MTKVAGYFIPIESRRLVNLALDLEGAEAIEDAAGPVEGSIVKAKIHGREEEIRHFDIGRYRRSIQERGAHHVWQIVIDVEREDVARGVVLDESIDDDEALREWLDLNDVADTEDLLTMHDGYAEKVAA